MGNTVIVKKQSTKFLTMLALLFIGLKLAGVIDWSWWWVLLPLWGGIGIVFGFAALLFIGSMIVLGIAALMDAHTTRKNKKILEENHKKSITKQYWEMKHRKENRDNK